MRPISFEQLVEAVREHGVDTVYLAIERLFYEESLIVINKEGKAIKTFFDPEEIYEYLEHLQEVEL